MFSLSGPSKLCYEFGFAATKFCDCLAHGYPSKSNSSVVFGAFGSGLNLSAKASSALGIPFSSTKLEIRLGGIYALERIAKDSPKDHWPIMEVLTAYVREHAKIKTPRKLTPKTSQEKNQSQFPEPAPDVQAILTVIGHRTLTYATREDRGLALNKTDLSGADLRRADLSGADLSEADLSGADLNGAHLSLAHLRGPYLRGAHLNLADLRTADLSEADLSEADLVGADLIGAYLGEADLRGAHLNLADLSGANLRWAHLNLANLRGANLSEADLWDADLSGADLSAARGLSPAQLESAKGNAATKLPPNIARPKSWPE